MLAIERRYQAPFRVLSARGYTLGKFSQREEALGALRTWEQAVAVIQDDQVIARKQGTRIYPVEKPPAHHQRPYWTSRIA